MDTGGPVEVEVGFVVVVAVVVDGILMTCRRG
jgi:hypothetical protein